MPDGLNNEVNAGDGKITFPGNGGTMDTREGDGETSETSSIDAEDSKVVKRVVKKEVVGDAVDDVRVDVEEMEIVKRIIKQEIMKDAEEDVRDDTEEKIVMKQIEKHGSVEDPHKEKRVDADKEIVKRIMVKEVVGEGQEEDRIDEDKEIRTRIVVKEVVGDALEKERVGEEENRIRKSEISDEKKIEINEAEEERRDPDTSSVHDPAKDREHEAPTIPPSSSGGNEIPETESTYHPSSIEHDRRWHTASRDWAICGISVSILLIILIFTIVITGVMKNFVLSLFFICCIALLGVVAATFLHGYIRLKDYQAITLFNMKDGQSVSEKIHDLIVRDVGEPEQLSPVVGKTFGLFSTLATYGLPGDEVIELNLIRMTSGLPVGLYLLVKAHPDSTVWNIMKELFEL